jgi:hypothetical protein
MRHARFIEKSQVLRLGFFLVGDGGFVTTSSLRSGQEPPTERKRDDSLGSCIGGLTIDLSTKQKTTAYAVVFAWWGMVDSDHRSQ